MVALLCTGTRLNAGHRYTTLTDTTKLSLTQALKITLIYLRHNLTEELLANIFEVSQPTTSRAIPVSYTHLRAHET